MNCSVVNLPKSQALRTPFQKNSGTSQAFCTAMMKMADSLRLFALFGRSTPENWGTSQAICIFRRAHDEIGRQS